MSFFLNPYSIYDTSSLDSPSDPYWNNVSLLLHGDGIGATPNGQQNNTFLDSSSNNFTITRSGIPTQGSFSPYALNGVAYSPTLHGGSGYFNGTTDYLNAGNNSALDLRSGNFTMEAWIYPTSVSGTKSICGEWNNEQGVLAVQNGLLVFSWAQYSIYSALLTSSTSILANNWTHVAVTRSANVFTLYINGINVASASSVNATSFSQPFVIGTIFIPGTGFTHFFDGYISNLRITKGLAVYTSNFTPPTSPVTLTSNGGATPSTAPTSGQVSLLCDFINGGIFDNTKKNVLTTAGNARVSTSVVKYGTGAMYFDGTGDYLTIPSSSNFAFGTGDFTIEAWVNCTNLAGGLRETGTMQIVDFRSSVVIENRPTLGIFASTFVFYSNGSTRIQSGTILANTWYHVVISKSSGITKMFVNGTQVGSSYTDSFSYLISAPTIGTHPAYADFFNGYIDDLRITKGIARYTSAFTPPTRALPDVPETAFYSDPYFDSTVLLLHGDGANLAQNNTFLDSSNNFTITRTGTPSQGSFSPYALNGVAYSPTLHGGSGYFNGTTDYLTVPSNAAFNFTSGTFTVESWVMTTNASAIQTTLTNYSSINTGWIIAIYLNKFVVNFSGDADDIQGTTTVLPNVWYHVAISGSAGSYKLFVNGVQEGSTYTGAASLAGGTLGIGALAGRIGYVGANPMVGYISNARIVNGRACYTSNFTPPTSPVTLLSNGGATPSTAPTSGQVVLLCDFTNGGIFDNTKKNVLTTAGNAKVSTSVVKYGTGAMYFDGTGDYLVPASNSTMALETGDFTIEAWISPSSTAEYNIYSSRDINDSSTGFSFGIVNGTLYIYSNGPIISTSTNFTYGQWNHVAVVRSSGFISFFSNGIRTITPTANSQNFTSTVIAIGASNNGIQFPFNGYIDDFRITKGVARYTSAFTPPTRAFADK